MPSKTLPPAPVAGQCPYAPPEAAVAAARRTTAEHWRQPATRADRPDRCGACGQAWEQGGCPPFRDAIASATMLPPIEVTWRAAPPVLPQIRFEFALDPDATVVLVLPPDMFRAEEEVRDKPRPHPRQRSRPRELEGAAA